MVLSVAGTVAGILLRPGITFRSLRSESPLDAAVIFGGSLVFFLATLSTASLAGLNRFLCWPWGFVTERFPFPGSIPFFLFVIIVFTGMWTIGALFWLYVAGGKGFINTVRAVLFSFTPILLFSWIPYVGVLTVPWALIIYIVALQELDRLPTGRAMLATFGMLLIPLIRGGFLLLTVLTSPGGITAVTDNELLASAPDLPPYVLTPADLPPGFTDYQVEVIHPERFLALDKQYGCLKKFQVSMVHGIPKSGEATSIDSSLAFFPAGKAAGEAKAEDDLFVKNSGGSGIGGIVCPKQGEVSFCHKYVRTDISTGVTTIYYHLIFAKSDTVAIISATGPRVNTTVIDELGSRAAAKIA
jgi:hypothetical protein